MKSTGPILAVGGITVVNQSIVHGEPIDWRVPIATGLAAGVFGFAEHFAEGLANGIAWLALITVLFVRLRPNVPSPVESFTAWWNQH